MPLPDDPNDALSELDSSLGAVFDQRSNPLTRFGEGGARPQTPHWRKVLGLAVRQRDREFGWLLDELHKEADRRGLLPARPDSTRRGGGRPLTAQPSRPPVLCAGDSNSVEDYDETL